MLCWICSHSDVFSSELITRGLTVLSGFVPAVIRGVCVSVCVCAVCSESEWIQQHRADRQHSDHGLLALIHTDGRPSAHRGVCVCTCVCALMMQASVLTVCVFVFRCWSFRRCLRSSIWANTVGVNYSGSPHWVMLCWRLSLKRCDTHTHTYDY